MAQFLKPMTALFLSLIGFAGANAQTIQSAPQTPNMALTYGCLNTYSVQGLNGPVKSYLWEFQMSTCPTWFPVTATNTAATETCYEIYPGAQTVRCTVQYWPNMGPNLVTVVPTLNINVPPPDTTTITSGDRVKANIGTPITVIFGMTSQGNTVPMATGIAQEQTTTIANIPGARTSIKPWGPLAAGDPNFYLGNSGTIVDVKLAVQGRVNSAYQVTAVGQPFAFATQNLQLTITDPCGVTTSWPLKPAYKIKVIKDPNNQYHFEHN